MIFQSTRSNEYTATGSAAILKGIAPDGGLYVPQNGELPALSIESLISLDTKELAAKVMGALLPDFTEDEMNEMVHRAYDGRFETEELTPLVPVGDSYVLELFRGPTSAFKDVALCMLPQLITASREKEAVKDEIVILTATSGDTGKAALEGFHDVPGTKIIVFYPVDGVSAVQKAQMTTQEGMNVTVCAVRGNFDDAQSGVKNAFAACEENNLLKGKGVRLSSANSINIGRLIPQTVYYFHAYCELVRSGRIQIGDKIDFTVPTGNFGDILAGYLAMEMGLPVGKLVCASNKNDVLTEFLSTGRYDRNREFYKTASPSMDILISSNLERLLYFTTKNPAQVAEWMNELKRSGVYNIPAELLEEIQKIFACGCCNEEQTAAAIAKVWNENGYLMDTHTAVAWHVAQQQPKTTVPMVVLSTASAFKFPAAVLTALGQQPEENEFDCLWKLSKLTNTAVPRGLAMLQKKAILHQDVINKEELLDFVLNKVEE